MLLVFFQYNLENRVMVFALQEAKKSRNGKAPHSSWCNYDDLNEYFWCARNFVLSLNLKFYELDSVLFLSFFFYSCICYLSFRSRDCFSLGWPMRDDGDFFKSTHDEKTIFQVFNRLFSGCYHCHKIFVINKIFTQENITVLQTKLPSRKRTEKGTGKTNFVETRTFWHIFRSFDRLWTFLILALQVFVLKYRIRRPTSVLL